MLLSAIATAIGTEAASSAILSLLGDLARTQDEQIAALRAIQLDVRALVEGPFDESKGLIETAAVTRDSAARRGYVARARDELMRAHSLERHDNPRRAAIAVNLALVLGMLGEPDAARLWARTAYDHQCAAVRAAVPEVLSALNSRVDALKSAIDGDFWALVETSRKEDPAGTARWVHEKYELGEYQEEQPPPSFLPELVAARQTEPGALGRIGQGLSGRRGMDATRQHQRRWAWEQARRRAEPTAAQGDAPPFLAHVAIAETTSAGGRELMRLHQIARNAREYRNVCLSLDPHTPVPAYELRVSLAQPRHAAIAWTIEPPAQADQLLCWRGAHERVAGVAFHPDGRRFAVATGASAHVLDCDNGRELLRVSHRRTIGTVWDVTISPDGDHIATASGDHSARVWSGASGREVLRVRHVSVLGFVRAVAFSPDGERLATAGGDSTVRVFDAASGRELLRVNHREAAWAVAFSPDGQRLASAAEDGTGRVWDAGNGGELLRMEHPDGCVAVAYSRDGLRLATGGKADVRIWDAGDGRELQRLSEWAFAVNFSPNGRTLAIGSEDAAIVFDAANGTERARLPHGDHVWGVAFSPDGRRLATACDDKTARIWSLG